jgi:hypothetical protein
MAKSNQRNRARSASITPSPKRIVNASEAPKAHQTSIPCGLSNSSELARPLLRRSPRLARVEGDCEVDLADMVSRLSVSHQASVTDNDHDVGSIIAIPPDAKLRILDQRITRQGGEYLVGAWWLMVCLTRFATTREHCELKSGHHTKQ